MPAKNLLSISYGPSVKSNATASGKIPGKSRVLVGPKAFKAGFAGLVQTIRHELEHVRQRAAGVKNKNYREFEAESVEILSRGLPEENLQRFMSDARRALSHWMKLRSKDRARARVLFQEVHLKLYGRYKQAKGKLKRRYRRFLRRYMFAPN